MSARAAFCLSLCLSATPLLARDVGVHVLDQDGTPLEDAVVTLRPAQGAVPAPVNNGTAVMDQQGTIFVPHVLVIRPGTRVQFPNRDRIRHHVYSFSKPKPFELKLYASTEVPSVLFDRPGVISLGCNIHDWMQGYIYITDDPWFALTLGDGRATFTGLADGAYRVHLWHPRLRGPYMGQEYDLEVGAATPAQVEYRVTVRSRQPAQQPPAADMDPAYGQHF